MCPNSKLLDGPCGTTAEVTPWSNWNSLAGFKSAALKEIHPGITSGSPYLQKFRDWFFSSDGPGAAVAAAESRADALAPALQSVIREEVAPAVRQAFRLVEAVCRAHSFADPHREQHLRAVVSDAKDVLAVIKAMVYTFLPWPVCGATVNFPRLRDLHAVDQRFVGDNRSVSDSFNGQEGSRSKSNGAGAALYVGSMRSVTLGVLLDTTSGVVQRYLSMSGPVVEFNHVGCTEPAGHHAPKPKWIPMPFWLGPLGSGCEGVPCSPDDAEDLGVQWVTCRPGDRLYTGVATDDVDKVSWRSAPIWAPV